MNKNQKIMIILVILSLIIPGIMLYNVLIPIPSEHTSEGPIHETSTTFLFENEVYTITINVSQDRFDDLNNSFQFRSVAQYSNSYRYITPNDSTIKYIAQQILQITELWNDIDRANFTLSYVQSIPYISDREGYNARDYWAFPVETLYLNGGDCANKSILFVSLMRCMGYDSTLLFNLNHAIAGVNIEGATGDYTSFMGTKYYWADCTAYGPIGHSPYDGFTHMIWWNILGLCFFIFTMIPLICMCIYYKRLGRES